MPQRVPKSGQNHEGLNPAGRSRSGTRVPMHQVIARTWRPQRFSDVIGQNHVTRTLQNAIRLGRTGHGYIFSGQRGVGKTTMARLLAKALNCAAGPNPEPCGECDSCQEITAGRAVDVIEIDAASNRGIDAVRELRENTRYAPARDPNKVFIIDEAHQITTEGFNALLKTLEEPPPHVVFILATTEIHELPETILSRCQHFAFHASSFTEILDHLRTICAAEKVDADPEALAALASSAGGSLRDALSHLEQAIAAFGSPLEANAVLRLLGVVPSQMVEEVFAAVRAEDRETLLGVVSRLVDEGFHLPHFCTQLVRAVRNMLVAKVAGPAQHLMETSEEECRRLVEQAAEFSEQDLMRYLEILLHLHQQLRHALEPRFQTELALLKLVEVGRLVSIEELLRQMESGGSAAPGDDGPSRRRSGGSTSGGSTSSGGGTGPGGSTASSGGVKPPEKPPLSPFEQDSLRKKQLSEESATADSSVSVSPSHPEAAPAAPGSGVTSGVASDSVASAVPAESASADATSNATAAGGPGEEIIRRLEERGKVMLSSLLHAAGNWEFGEGEARIATASNGLASVLPPADLQMLETVVSEVIGRKMRVEFVQQPEATPAGGGGAIRAQPGGKAASDPQIENTVRADPEVAEFVKLFRAPVTGIRKWRS